MALNVRKVLDDRNVGCGGFEDLQKPFDTTADTISKIV